MQKSRKVGCVVVDVHGFEIVLADDLNEPTVLDVYEDDVSLLVHDFDEARSVMSFRARRANFANEICLDPYVVIFRHDSIKRIAKIVSVTGAFLGQLPFDLDLAGSGFVALNAR